MKNIKFYIVYIFQTIGQYNLEGLYLFLHFKMSVDFTMDNEKKHFIEICTGFILIVIGFLLDWWSKQLVWIEIYPPPIAKQIIEVLPFLFWGLSALLIVDGVRRMTEQWKHQNENLNEQK